MNKSNLSKQQRKSIVQLACIWGLVENHYKDAKLQKIILELMTNYLYMDKPEGERFITIIDRVMIDSCIDKIEKFGKQEKVKPTPEQVLAIADVISYEHLLYVKDKRKMLWEKIQNIVINDTNYKKMDVSQCEISELIYELINDETNKNVSDYLIEIEQDRKERAGNNKTGTEQELVKLELIEDDETEGKTTNETKE